MPAYGLFDESLVAGGWYDVTSALEAWWLDEDIYVPLVTMDAQATITASITRTLAGAATLTADASITDWGGSGLYDSDTLNRGLFDEQTVAPETWFDAILVASFVGAGPFPHANTALDAVVLGHDYTGSANLIANAYITDWAGSGLFDADTLNRGMFDAETTEDASWFDPILLTSYAGPVIYDTGLLLSAVVGTTNSTTTSLDASVQTRESTATGLDALVAVRFTVQTALDAVVQGKRTTTTAFNALIQTSRTRTTSLDAHVDVANTPIQEVDLDAVIQATLDISTGLDAVVLTSFDKTTSLDAVVLVSDVLVASLDAVVQATDATTTGLDAVILALSQIDTGLDAVIQVNPTSPMANLDATVQATQDLIASLDAVVQTSGSATTGLDATILSRQALIVGVDAFILSRSKLNLGLDALIESSESLYTYLTAYVSTGGTVSTQFRRPGAQVATIIESASDPAPEADRLLLYSKDDGGVSQLFARSDDGTVHQITPASSSTADIAKYAVRVATDAPLPACTFAGGTLTADSPGDLNTTGIDGVVTLAVGNRVLVKNEGDETKNLIYTIDDLGSDPVGPATPTCPSPPVFGGSLLTCGSGGTYADLSTAVAAASPGDRIEILPGTIVEASSVVVNKSLEIFGTGPTCIVQSNSLTSVIQITVADVYLHDFRVVNNQAPSGDPSGQSCCVNADTMSRTALGGVSGIYLASLTLTFPKVGVFVSGTSWVVRDCTFASNIAVAGTTIRALFSYGSEGTSFACNNDYDGPNDAARLTAIYLNTRNDGIAPAWESGYKGALVIDGETILPGKGAPRSYIDATSIYHQSGTATTFPPYGQFDLYVVNNNFSVNHGSSPCVFFGRSYGATPVAPLSFFGGIVVDNNSFGARTSGNQKGAIFWTNTSGGPDSMGTLLNFWGASNTIAPAVLPGTNSSIMADSSLLMVRENAFYLAPVPLLTLTPTVPGTPWSMTWASDFDTNAEVTRGVFAGVSEGVQNEKTDWIVVTPDPIVVGSTGLQWELFGKQLVVRDEGGDVVVPTKVLDFVGAGVTVTDAGSGVTTITIPGGGGGGGSYELYGDGGDGNVSFDGISAAPGCTLAGAVYTMTRDLFLNDAAVNLGVTVATNGFRIWCRGTLTCNGSINDDGRAGGIGNLGGAAAAGGTVRAVTYYERGSAGGQGMVYLSVPLPGDPNAYCWIGSGDAGGAGGVPVVDASAPGGNGIGLYKGGGGGTGGGAGGGSAGGGANGGTVTSIGTVTAVANDTGASPRQYSSAVTGWVGPPLTTGGIAGNFIKLRGGSGGGGGGTSMPGGGGCANGGGGGSGGGIVFLAAHTLTGTGKISAEGGPGGAGSAGNAGFGNTGGGGGGGGGGGTLFVLTTTSLAALTVTLSANGGAGGAGGIAVPGFANGAAGGTGAPGILAFCGPP